MHSPRTIFSSVPAHRLDNAGCDFAVAGQLWGGLYARRLVALTAGVKPAPQLPLQLRRQLSATTAVSAAFLILLSAGCRDSSVKAYRIAKEHDVVASRAMGHAGADAGPGGGMSGATVATKTAGANLAWTAPAHWKNKPGSAMRRGSYAVEADGASADVSITAFPGDVGGEVANVNRWRNQIQLDAVGEQEVEKAITRFDAHALQISYVDLVNGSKRMLAAFVPFDGATWFFKLTGATALVGAEKEAFVSFLNTVRPNVGGVTSPRESAAAGVEAPDPHPALDTKVAETGVSKMDDVTVKKSDGPNLQWTAPATWQVGAPNAMRKGSYRIAGQPGAVAEVSITAFPGNVGGEVANVNRWRNQLGLPAAPAAEIASAVTHRAQGGLQISIVEITSPPGPQAQRLIGAIVPFGEATWFFKLTGPDQLVAGETTAFLAFIETIHAP